MTTAACTVLAVVASPGVALAHQLHYGDSATNWLSTVTAVTPRGAMAAATGDAGQRLTASIRRATTVVILGYNGEPFVRLRTSGAWVNERSTTTYAVAGPQATVPADADDSASPRWRRVAATGSWSWHDSRTHWPGYALPPPVEQQPDRRQQVLAWTVPFVADGVPGSIRGTLDWVPGPSGAFGALVAGLAFVAFAALAAMRRWRGAVAVALTALVAVDLVHSIGMADGRIGGLGSRLSALPGHGVLPLLLWLAAAGAVVLLRGGRELGLYLTALLGVLLCFSEALPSLGVVWHSQYANALPGALNRSLVAILTGGSTGLVVGAVLLLVRFTPRSDPAGNPAADLDDS